MSKNVAKKPVEAEEDEDFETLVGRLELYEDTETGSDLVALITPDGEEYVITNKRMAKKLMEYTEDDIDMEFKGEVEEDPYSKIKILTVKSYRSLQELYHLPGTIENSCAPTADLFDDSSLGADDFSDDMLDDEMKALLNEDSLDADEDAEFDEDIEDVGDDA